jgi:hypothetical protein
MSDNVQLDAGSGGAVVRTIDKQSKQVPVSIIDVGNHANDDESFIQSHSVGMPVEGLADDGHAIVGAPVLIGGTRHDSSAIDLSVNQAGVLSLDNKRNLKTSIFGGSTGTNALDIDLDGAVLLSGMQHSVIDFDTDQGETKSAACFGIVVPSSTGPVAIGSSSIQDTISNANQPSVLGLNTSQIGSFFFDGHTGADDTTNVAAFGIAIASATGPKAVGSDGATTTYLPVSVGNEVAVSLGTDFVHVAGRTNITDTATATSLLVDSAGHLQVDVQSLPNVYTEDLGAADDPVGGVSILVREDASSSGALGGSLVDADGDNVAQRGTNYGSSYVTSVSSDGKVGVLEGWDYAVAPATPSAKKLKVDSGGSAYVVSNLATIAGTDVSVDSGPTDEGTQRVVIATDDVNISSLSSVVATANALITNADTAAKVSMIGAVVDEELAAASTPYADGDAAPLKVTRTGALHVEVGTPSLGESSASIGNVGVASISAGANLIGDVGIQGRETGGLSMHSKLNYVNTPVDVKGSAGTVYGITVFNMTASPFYIKFYNEATSVNRSTHTPVLRFAVPANASSSGAGFVFNVPQGLAFGFKIQYAITTGVADTDTSGISSGDAVVNIAYK